MPLENHESIGMTPLHTAAANTGLLPVLFSVLCGLNQIVIKRHLIKNRKYVLRSHVRWVSAASRSERGALVGCEAADVGLTVGADEALAETHTQTQEEDRRHAAHWEQDDHGWTHYGTQTHT